MRKLGFVFCAALAACDFGTLDDLNQEHPVEGGDELTNEARTLWRVFGQESSDAEIKRAIADIDGIVTRAGSLPVQTKLGPMNKDDLAKIGFDAKDPTHAQGMLIVTQLDCSLEQIERLAIAKNQTVIYPGGFDKYARTYRSNVKDFLRGDTKTLEWATTYTKSVLGQTFEATSIGAARRVPGATADGRGVLLGRLYQEAPARFIKGDQAAYEQDYQVALYVERGPKTVLHFYALWQQFHVQSLTSESDLYVAGALGNLVDFGVRTSKVCREGAPKPEFD